MRTQNKTPSVGLQVLYEPEQNDSTLIDVVLVHGFGGHPMRSWQYDDQPAYNRTKAGTHIRDGPLKLLLKKATSSDYLRWSRSSAPPPLLWPRDLLPSSCPEARIITWGYRSLHSGNMPVPVQPDLFSHAEALLRDLACLRQSTGAQRRPLIFIAHSLGGVIVKEALYQAEFHSVKWNRFILSSIAAVIFFGCPHRTMEREPDRDAVVSMAEATLSTKTERPVLSALCGVNNPRWGEAQRSFIQLWYHFNFVVKTYQEIQGDANKSTNSNTRLNELGNAKEHAETLPANHRTMCQFKSNKDAGFQSLEKILVDIVEDEKAKHRGLTEQEKNYLERFIGAQESQEPPSIIAESSLETCEEIWNTREFLDWYCRREGRNKSLLWLTGESGSGKSTQLRQLRCRIEKQWEPGTASIIYCTAESQNLDRAFMSMTKLGIMRAATTIRSILSQLFAQDLNLRRSLSLCEGRIDNVDVIRFFLDDYLTNKARMLTRRTFILVDAENTGDDGYIHDLLYILCQMARNSDFSVCLASRPVTGRTPVDSVQLELHQYNLEHIVGLVQSRLRATWEERFVAVRKVAEKARGKFLWAQLATNLLNKVIDGGGGQDLVDQVLGELPVDLYGLYEWILGTLSPKEKAETTVIMRWVMLSAEPMMLNDLCMAVRLGRTHFLVCSDPITALDVGSPWSMQDLQRTGKHFDSPSQFYEWLRARTCGLLETRAADYRSKAQSLGFQHVHPIHPSIKSFFLSGRGFATLAAGQLKTIPPDHEAVDFCHYSLLRTILMYLNTSDQMPLVSWHGPLSKMSPASRSTMAEERSLIASSHPFLQYAVDNLLYHLLSPQPLRYFLPQRAIFNTFISHDCRLWRRWTALLGETDALKILARCRSAEGLLRPEFGTSIRLERIFRAVNRIATGGSWFSIHKSPRLSIPIPRDVGEKQRCSAGIESVPKTTTAAGTHNSTRNRGCTENFKMP
ncbi:hypothetical protein GGS21DRAFT_535264 [Xylaria nigripes]|nr:hypothetical protein GGS21DRAFT_535264 [Xylaria nigripes]